ncbi:MAG: hypothetical protein FJZ92_03490 [Chloroflexi bacterium]|nr:hypothetical protein [Chloroflexota bacterium]
MLRGREAWARARRAHAFLLWVNEALSAATRLYERAGYQRTGASEPLRRGSSQRSIEFSRALAPGR